MSTDLPPSAPPGRRPRWGGERRLQFIDFRLRWEGKLNRKDLVAYFGVSVPQASADIARYAELAPSNLTYDPSSRTYLASPSFEPLFSRSAARRYLAEQLAATTGVMERSATFLGTAVDVDVVPSPNRAVRDSTVAALARAIRDTRRLRVTYQSMSSPTPTARELSPHAFGYDGFRWHVRAFCHTRNSFNDFVLGRMLTTEDVCASDIESSADLQWHTIVTLTLAPHPSLTDGAKRAIEIDYQMENGEMRLSCRQAFLFYTLNRLGLTPRDTTPAAQQIVLRNAAEVQPYIDALTRT